MIYAFSLLIFHLICTGAFHSRVLSKINPRARLQMTSDDPLLLRAARGEEVERVPVWMMRQAGRHMAVYRDLVKKHKTFRERSENPDLATEISLQPWRAYGTDGCILFSDILTPFPGMNVPFDILEKEGPKMTKKWNTMVSLALTLTLTWLRHQSFAPRVLTFAMCHSPIGLISFPLFPPSPIFLL
jgi:uroporphyrinogen-III decarboxylase